MSVDMFPDAAIDYLIEASEPSGQVWFMTDYDSVWAVTGSELDIAHTAGIYKAYIFFYGPPMSVESMAEIQPESRGSGVLFPPVSVPAVSSVEGTERAFVGLSETVPGSSA